MGRDIAGLRIDKKSGMVNVKSNGTNHDAVLVSPKAAPDIDETTDQGSAAPAVNGGLPDQINRDQDVVGLRSTNREPEEKIIQAEDQRTPDKKLSPSVKPALGSAVNGLNEANSPEPVTPVVGDGKESHTGYTNGTETNASSGKFSSQDDHDAHTPKRTYRSQPRSPSMSAKLHSQYNKFYDEDDASSLASSTATSVRTNKSRVTVPVAPKFTVIDRLERRKEYYSKLEEKHKALQKEKLDYEARIKEEEAAAIKQLRKNMVVKANPVPNFYREGPPPKPELKKLPLTRPKSPNLTRSSPRRKSCGDATRASLEDKGLNGRVTRHSVGVLRDSKYSPGTPKGKDRSGPRKSIETSKLKNRPKVPTGSPKPKEIRDADNAVES
ncbi:protein WVD2-like 2 isoform X2 [Andrographis paniculata]|uniref:protein WVD2-like 2 isoform X2 n=1 Tax=Andrographis paniculata TaxID=175694 RepID=UPI0021E7F04D|nr:protein WVD2-like 2 isoform X2 [Andrographis paniculata]